MQAVVGAILILAGSVLITGGLVADALKTGQGISGYVLGGILGLVGLAILVSSGLKRAWDAIPVQQQKPSPPP